MAIQLPAGCAWAASRLPNGFTAKVVAHSGQTIRGKIDATGYDLGISIGPGVHGVAVVGARVTGAKDEGIMVQDARRHGHARRRPDKPGREHADLPAGRFRPGRLGAASAAPYRFRRIPDVHQATYPRSLPLRRDYRDTMYVMDLQPTLPRRIAVLGCTGSIGRSALDLAARHPDLVQVVALAANRDVDGLLAAAARFRPQAVAVADTRAAAVAAERLDGSGIALVGVEEAAAWPAADCTLVAIAGVAGLRPAVAAAVAGKRLALANKESLVAAGAALLRAARSARTEVLPVDSEHAGLFAALQGVGRGNLRRLWLTASGGPLRGRSPAEVAAATPAAALNHPTWPGMGRRITVDTATLLNKGLEVVEAHHLFGVPVDAVGVVVHPQSVVHAIVELADGSLLMQASRPDMRLPIAFAIGYPERWAPPEPAIAPSELPALEFGAPDREAFPCLDLAYAAGRAGGTAPAVLNGADEVAVTRFLAGEFPLGAIPRLLEAVLGQHRGGSGDPDVEEALAADAWARERAAAWRPAAVGRRAGR